MRILARLARAAPLALSLAPLLAVAGCGTPPRPRAPAAASPFLAGDQYLYGSGEAAAVSRQAWNALADYAERARAGRRGVVLAAGATLAAPRFVPCGAKPPAAVFDVDETVLLNLGFEYDQLAAGRPGFDQQRWLRWEQGGVEAVAPVPGAREGLARLRALGITVIFNTNRSAANAGYTEQALDRAGLGPARHGETLFLMGDDEAGPAKDGRRARIAARYCVIALGGDQLGDFSDLFTAEADPAARRALTALPGIAGLWGRGWFALPNPVYGAGLKGGIDTIFPPAQRWTDPGAPTTGKGKGRG
ncbi:HAD family acid phosphatase [Sphingomonas morindae]|uniref:Acid phosphatase n=1 Tax=Sphingomonas morindae TaxID=1541170 RepID=A0ABY4XAG1_9SPHN|nr:HAD family acid phosphatase [Sphingomonas morindae]USI73685.1 acid phosphatase [Sphingomonas morindae]